MTKPFLLFKRYVCILLLLIVSYISQAQSDWKDQLGRKVSKLISESQKAGNYTFEWNRKQANGQVLPNRMYLYELVTQTKRIRKKLIIN